MAEEDQTATAPVDLGEVADKEPESTPAAFDWNVEIPLDEFPEGMRESLKGKTFKDFAVDHAKFRQAASKIGARNKELEAELEKKSTDKPELSDEEIDALLEKRQTDQMVQTPDYQEVLEAYFETDEIPDAFVDAVEKNGVRVARDDLEDFMLWRKERRQQTIENMTSAAEGRVEGQDLWDWMALEDCPLDRDMIRGFNKQARKGDYSWVGLASKEYGDWIEAGGKQTSRRSSARFDQGPTRRGRPTQPRPGEGDISFDEFQSEILKVRQLQTSGQINKADAMRRERELVARRRRTSGEQ